MATSIKNCCAVLAILFVLTFSWASQAADGWDAQRDELVQEIRQHVEMTQPLTGRGSLERRVMEALERVPRHEFVPDDVRDAAYENRPLPIGHGQTISQPYIVALMTDLLETREDHVVLEIGTGSGYQAAVLAELVAHVYSIEIIKPLEQAVAERLDRLGYDNVTVRYADGYEGWEQHAPFDSIIVTAAGSHIPPPLVEQLKPGGRMILPVGGRFTAQHLVLVSKDDTGHVSTRQILPVRFVPLTRDD